MGWKCDRKCDRKAELKIKIKIVRFTSLNGITKKI